MLIMAIIFIGMILLPAVVAAGYDTINKHHDAVDVGQVWVGTMIVTAVIPMTVYLVFFG